VLQPLSRKRTVLPANTFCPLKLVVWPTWLILQDRLEFRIECGRLTPGDAAGELRSRAYSAVKNVVTCDKAPSAVCSKPTRCAFCCDWFRAAMFAVIPSAIDNPRVIEPELICRPVESCVRVFAGLPAC